MKIDDEVIKRMCDAFEKVFEDADYQTREPISPMARQVAEDAMHSAAAVLQRLHEEELERVLGDVTDKEKRRFNLAYMDSNCNSSELDRLAALEDFLASRRAPIAPEPTLEEKIHAILVRNHGGESHWSTTKEIIALL